MFAIKRNQVMITALLVMVMVAGYLNFAEIRNGQSGDDAVLLRLFLALDGENVRNYGGRLHGIRRVAPHGERGVPQTPAR